MTLLPAPAANISSVAPGDKVMTRWAGADKHSSFPVSSTAQRCASLADVEYAKIATRNPKANLKFSQPETTFLLPSL
jgi:hypothetical protein